MPAIKRKRTAAAAPMKRRFKRKMTAGRRPKRTRTFRKKTFAADPSVMKINPKPIQVVRVIKGTSLIPSYGLAVSGTTGLQLQLSGTGYSMGRNYTFDPSGNFGNFSGTISNAATTIGPCAAQTFFAYIGVYKYYKVDKITVNFRYDDLGLADSCSPTLFVRYHDGEINTNTPSPSQIAAERQWIAKKFDSGNSTFKYSFIPLVQKVAVGGTTFANLAKSSSRMNWTSVDTPVEIFGLRLYINWPTNANPDLNSFINMDVLYHISFKEQS